MKKTIKYILVIIGLLYVLTFILNCISIVTELYYTKDMLECILYEFLEVVPKLLIVVISYGAYLVYQEYHDTSRGLFIERWK